MFLGLAGYLAGVTVAVKQVMPDHILYRSPVGKITNRNVPLTLFALSFVLWAVGLVEGSYCTMFFTGLLVAWIYLRFYQVRDTTQLQSNPINGSSVNGSIRLLVQVLASPT